MSSCCVSMFVCPLKGNKSGAMKHFSQDLTVMSSFSLRWVRSFFLPAAFIETASLKQSHSEIKEEVFIECTPLSASQCSRARFVDAQITVVQLQTCQWPIGVGILYVLLALEYVSMSMHPSTCFMHIFNLHILKLQRKFEKSQNIAKDLPFAEVEKCMNWKKMWQSAMEPYFMTKSWHT